MDLHNIHKPHIPTIEELQDLYRNDKDGYDNAVAAYSDVWEEKQDPHAALKEMHRMESGVNYIDASKGCSVLEGPYKGPRIEIQSIGFALEKNNNGFMKNDTGKNMVSLVDPAFVLLLGDILTFGAKKYAPNNWQLCEDTSRYKDALLRHIYAYLAGETVDPESGLSHLGHAAFGLMCLNYFDNREQNEK